jgi:hypothetical protein
VEVIVLQDIHGPWRGWGGGGPFLRRLPQLALIKVGTAAGLWHG